MSRPATKSSIERVYSEAEAAHLDLRIGSAPGGTIAIMFLDIEGSTAIANRVGDLRFMDLLREHNAIVRTQVKAHDGFETKAEGDGFMIVFDSARNRFGDAPAVGNEDME